MKNKFTTSVLAKVGLLAALYAVITIIAAPISYGAIQVRISEALTILPFFYGNWAAVALWIGCFFANIFGGNGLIDVIFGSLITLIAGLLTARASKITIGALYPVLLNGIGVGMILYYTLDLPFSLFQIMLYVMAGEAISVFIIGIPLMKLLVKKVNFFDKN